MVMYFITTDYRNSLKDNFVWCRLLEFVEFLFAQGEGGGALGGSLWIFLGRGVPLGL